MTNITLAKEKRQYIGARENTCVDIRKTRVDGILQSVVQMPLAPALEEDLKSIVALQSLQRVDITALISSVSNVRNETTAYGRKQILDTTIIDGSKEKDEEEQVSAKFSMFFDESPTGTALLESMQGVATAKTPIALYGLTCVPQREGKCEFKTSQVFFWEAARGTYPKLLRLQNQADELLGATSTSITAEWVAETARDFAAETAIYTVCGCIAALLSPPSGTEGDTEEPEGIYTLFQINHCYVATPSAGEQVVTNDGQRIWLQNVRIMDATGSVTVAVREKAALALSRCESTIQFKDAHGKTISLSRCCRACAFISQGGGPKKVAL